MEILTIIVVGLIAGWITSLFFRNNRKRSLLFTLVLGVIGAFVGSYLMQWLGYGGVSGFNLYSIFVATIGSILVVIIGKILF